jgi:hypothetical protein
MGLLLKYVHTNAWVWGTIGAYEQLCVSLSGAQKIYIPFWFTTDSVRIYLCKILIVITETWITQSSLISVRLRNSGKNNCYDTRIILSLRSHR